ncbi:MAG: hypothetical protein HYW15_00895 [Candidatus Giovannonibacteria bacterium]|nr:MAG: hypothetical protein HYW15_00895 [Candidatus Giovannonibacteria bacterium]
MKKASNKAKFGKVPQTPQLPQLLRGIDLKDYKIIPDFELKERIVGNEKESAKTNLLEKTTEFSNTTIVTSS